MNAEEYIAWAHGAVNSRFREIVQDLEKESGMALAATFLGGKRFRSALALLSCQAVGGAPDLAIDIAIGVELAHQGSLAHDDILDGDEQRRGRKSVWRDEGAGRGVMVGNLGLTAALRLFSSAGCDFQKIATHAFSRMALGAARETVNNTEFDELKIMDVADLKTASLMAAACQAGALAGGAGPSQLEAFHIFGRRLGMAYQLADDLVDFKRSMREKKPLGDVRLRRLNAPMYYLWKSGSKKPVESYLSENSDFSGFLAEIGAAREPIALCRSQIDHHAKDASKFAASLPDSKYRALLAKAPGAMVARMLGEAEE